jgi:aminopeptidase N
MLRRLCAAFALVALAAGHALATPITVTRGTFEDKFRQLEGEEWPTPTDYRAASGAPGHRYWQQKVDYRIDVRLDETRRRLAGTAAITYANNSPDTLTYLWLLLDQNNFRRASMAELTQTTAETNRISYSAVRRAQRMRETEGGFDIKAVTTTGGAPLRHSVVDTLLRVDLPAPLKPGETVSFRIGWENNLVETRVVGARSGYECFEKPGEDGNCIFLAAQWFPRLAAYSDFEGWHNKAFLGAGEFTLEFGDYEVAITAPADVVVASTGELQNPSEVLTPAQMQRLAAARSNYKEPVKIVTGAEAAANEKDRSTDVRTWRFKAANVRDFAWAGSRKFIWDAMAVRQPRGADVLAMSFFPKEAEPLWSAWSTKAVAHTIDVYSRYSIPYPYPVALSVNGPVGGMEYPMITFNGPRPEKDPATGALTYSDRTKAGLIGVIIHEIGHIYFPMVINSDERQWTWMDEGLNTFLQYLAEQEWEPNFPSRRGDPRDIIEYMRATQQTPIMTQSDSTLRFGDNQYGKPATALVILRETVLGREAFDRAFKEYSERWAFKRPTPYDFFRTMEESSGVDLDWFWRGWFYSTDAVDIALTDVTRATVGTGDPDVEKPRQRAERAQQPGELTFQRNMAEGIEPRSVRDPAILDWYSGKDEFIVTAKDRETYQTENKALEPWEQAARQAKENFYILRFENRGGLVMPVIVRFTFTDGSSETVRIPAEIWRRDAKAVNWTYVTLKEVKEVELDPLYETADIERSNNYFPQRIEPTRLEVFKDRPGRNPMSDDNQRVAPDSLRVSPAPPPPARR